MAPGRAGFADPRPRLGQIGEMQKRRRWKWQISAGCVPGATAGGLRVLSLKALQTQSPPPQATSPLLSRPLISYFNHTLMDVQTIQKRAANLMHQARMRTASAVHSLSFRQAFEAQPACIAYVQQCLRDHCGKPALVPRATG
jgi:hypothetical protein